MCTQGFNTDGIEDEQELSTADSCTDSSEINTTESTNANQDKEVTASLGKFMKISILKMSLIWINSNINKPRIT